MRSRSLQSTGDASTPTPRTAGAWAYDRGISKRSSPTAIHRPPLAPNAPDGWQKTPKPIPRSCPRRCRRWTRRSPCHADSASTLTPQPRQREQLLTLGRAWEPDFVWMHPGPGDQYRLVGGVVCFPSSWAIRDKLDRTMAEIHAPAPDLNATLARPIDAFMSRQRPGEVWVRENVNFAARPKSKRFFRVSSGYFILYA